MKRSFTAWKRWAMPLTAALLTAALAGCAKGDVRPLAAGGGLVAAAVDEHAGGLHVSTLLVRPQDTPGQLRTNALLPSASRTYAAFSDIAFAWRQQTPPQLLLLGDGWARTHGFPAAWARQLYRIGIGRGGAPQVAVVQGRAESFLQLPGQAEAGLAAMRASGGNPDPFRRGSLAYEEDLLLPYLTPGEDRLTARSILFKQQQFSGVWSERDTLLLSCLQGSGLPQRLPWPEAEASGASPSPAALEQAACAVRVSASGDLKQAMLRLRLTITHPGPAGDEARWAQALSGASRELIGRLQALEADPLHWGGAMQRQYRGIWSQERWRQALARATVQLDVSVHATGGGSS